MGLYVEPITGLVLVAIESDPARIFTAPNSEEIKVLSDDAVLFQNNFVSSCSEELVRKGQEGSFGTSGLTFAKVA